MILTIDTCTAAMYVLQLPLWQEMRKEGLPIEGFCVAAGILTTEKAVEIIDGLKAAGIRHVFYVQTWIRRWHSSSRQQLQQQRTQELTRPPLPPSKSSPANSTPATHPAAGAAGSTTGPPPLQPAKKVQIQAQEKPTKAAVGNGTSSTSLQPTPISLSSCSGLEAVLVDIILLRISTSQFWQLQVIVVFASLTTSPSHSLPILMLGVRSIHSVILYRLPSSCSSNLKYYGYPENSPSLNLVI